MPDPVEAHERVKDFDWSPSYAARRERYPTKYRIPRKTKDPFRHLIRDYCSMEQEKDDRQYGAMEDVLARSDAPAHAHRKWLEILKIVIPATNFAEYAAMKCVAQLIDTVENAELRQGYMAQMIDEVRHTHQQMYLNRYFARHAPDPDGFAYGMKFKGRDLFGRASRTAFETFFMGDPIEGAINLQVIAETAYTNPVFVSMTQVAALQGDQATPSVFLSVQSDEARHMANGYSTLAAIVSEEDNLPHLQADFERAFWRQHTFLDPFVAGVYDYAQVTRSSSYLEKWREWIAEDWVGSYISRLEPFGLKAPSTLALAEERVRWCGHTAAMVGMAGWPLVFWRQQTLTPADFEWFEEKYPGWYDHYGWFYEGMAEMTEPGSGNPFLLFPEMPPLCRVCQMPCIFPRIDVNTIRIREHADRRHAFCSQPCERIFDEDPGRYLGYRTFWEIWDGHGLDEYIVKQGLLRADGRTLLPQPHNSDDPRMMWTLDDITALDVEIRDPLNNPESIYVVA
ncbi:MAG: hypothetical protein JWM18_3295 [Chloroflexi bacterium]|nr:hypothetical protein [Chloroflexota bacterium]